MITYGKLEDWNEEGGRCPNFEEKGMTAEELERAYFICPYCNQLAERGFLGMPESEFMCTNCGQVQSYTEKANNGEEIE